MNIADLDYQHILSNKGIILGGSTAFERVDRPSVYRNPETNEPIAVARGSAFSLAGGPKANAVVTGFSMAGLENGLLYSQSSSSAVSNVGEPPG